MNASHAPYAVAVAVGPDATEIERVRDLAASVAAYEPRGSAWFVMVDDAVEPRGLERVVALPAGVVPIGLHHPRHDRAQTFRVGKGIVSAVLLALRWIQANTNAAFVLKLDTDSLVINPFRTRLETLFATAPNLGVVGAHTRTPNGTPRDWSHHARSLQSMLRPSFSIASPFRSLLWKRDPKLVHVGTLVAAARANGYDLGEHCMGGGYAVSRALLDRLAAAGHLDDVSRWMGVDLPEDVVIGLHARAVGMVLADDVDAGGVFGVRYQGLPFPPAVLAGKGYAVIHAVKNDPAMDELTIRAFFARRRSPA